MITVTPIKAFSDNYIWLIENNSNNTSIVVDPGDPSAVNHALESKGIVLSGILITHHHWDHVGGVQALVNAFPGIPVWGPANENIAHLTHRLKEGDPVDLPIGATLEVYDVPGHTSGHIAYYGCFDGNPVLFCGDTLFSSGCGRLFEGTPHEMYTSLGKLAALAPETLVYCTHEYTRANLSFASAVEPHNQDILDRITEVESLLARNQPSIPSTISLEQKVNPFLRCHVSEVIASACHHTGTKFKNPEEVFAALRGWKDTF